MRIKGMREKLRLYILSALVMLSLTSMSPSKSAILILVDEFNVESFSKFSVTENNGVLIGSNIDSYDVADGIYRIKGTSNNKYYNRNIVIN